MKVTYVAKTAVTGLSTNRTRSLLTVLGIVIGITSIMLMMAIGRGAENLILGEISALGAETLVVRPGQEPEGITDITNLLFLDSITLRDVEALKNKSNVPDLVSIMPIVIVPGSASYKGEAYTGQMLGGDAKFWADAFDIYPEEGDIFYEIDIRQKASVAIIGEKVRQELFGDEYPIGESITIKDRKFRVVGVFPSKGQLTLLNVDDTVLIPYTTAQTYLLGISHFHEVIIKVTSPDAVPRAVRDIEATLREMHGITDSDKDDFYVTTQQGLVDQVGTIIGALTTFLSSVVAIALVVGGIGVMNIMLVSVTERTREIGLRKSLGATNKDILRQFLLEAVILTGFGGVVGIGLGTLLSFAASYLITTYGGFNWPFAFPLSAAVLGIVVSTLVGLIFGLYPARKASRKSPIEALRYE